MSELRPLASTLKTDWNKCCLCQIEKDEDLKCPLARCTSGNDGDGYAMIARNIPLFKAINQMPIILEPGRLDQGESIEETLRKNKAKYHQSCRLLFNNSKLERARKRSRPTTGDRDENIPSKRRRSSIDNWVCFLCDKEAPLSDLRQAMTMELDTRLNECAKNLNDGKLLAVLSCGDVIAQELKYHRSCLTALYNRERTFLSKLENEKDQTAYKGVHPIVFAELLVYVMETKIGAEGPLVFRLAELVSLYNQRMKQLNVETENIHSTRLKEQLLAEIPELEAHKKGRDILLAFKQDVSVALSQAMAYSEALIVTKAAKILRMKMLEHKTSFNGTFEEKSIEDSVPSILLQFVCMVQHGADIESQLRFGSSKTDFAMAQLLQFNCYSKFRKGCKTSKHSSDRETPFPIYLGLSIYGKTRMKHLVEILHEHGLSISYDRVLALSSQLGDAAVNMYMADGVVCPSVLRKTIFTTAAMDNIDHNPSSTTATTSFHGTSISVFQHPTSENQGQPRKTDHFVSKAKKVPELPDSYTNVHPAFFTKQQPETPSMASPIKLKKINLEPEFNWLRRVSLVDSDTEEIDISWSVHHAAMKRGVDFEASIASLLPLLRDQAHSVATIRHVLDRIQEIVSFLNPGQTPVIAADQPIYATAKQIQWHWPERYGEDKFVIMFGGLHIEMTAFRSLGTLLADSGWTGALVESGVASSGTAESFLSASSVTRTRQMHQVTACCLFKLLLDAYNEQSVEAVDGNLPQLDMNDWCEKRASESPQFQFWIIIMKMELTTLSLVRSFREADFLLYCQSLQELIPYFFANNNVNYARWLPIHLRDMVNLEHTHPQVNVEFLEGNFVIHKSRREFSALAIDQAHEQSNALIKGDGGAIGVTEDPSALRRWMVAGPEVSRVVSQYEQLSGTKNANEQVEHHEQTKQVQRTFIERVDKLYTTMKEMGNPFTEVTDELLTLDTKSVAHPSAAAMVADHIDNGKEKFDDFMKSLQVGEKSKFYEAIKKNRTDFFRQHSDPTSKDLKQKHLKDECQLFSKLFISCQSRECDLQEFFKHENQSFPASLSDNGKLLSCQKSQLVPILQDKATLPDTLPNVEVIIIDGSALVNAHPPRTSKTFEEYATKEFASKIQSYSSKYLRTDIVFDVYRSCSLKAETRSKRGVGARRRVTASGKIPSNWQSFLRDSRNKTELFSFLAEKVVEHEGNIVVATREETVLSNQDIGTEDISNCNHEEADTRLFVHARHAAEHGSQSVLIKASDTDVLIIAVSVFSLLNSLGLHELWIEFGQGKNLRWIPIHDIYTSIGPDMSRGILFFHAFTGCDVVSSFRGKGKKTAWQTWSVCPQVTEVFTRLSHYPLEITDEDQELLELFVITMYDRSSSLVAIDEARFDLFARKQRSYDSIPPTRAALIEHVKRAAYQAGCIWGQTLVCQMENVSPGEFGWVKKGDSWEIVWTNLAPIAESCQQLTKCGCNTQCRGRCKCYRLSLPCTAMCSCNCDN